MFNNALFCSNIRGGGALQVAISTLVDFSRDETFANSLDIYISNPIYKQVIALGINLSVFKNCFVQDDFGIKQFFSPRLRRISNYSSVLVLFGPFYSLFKPVNLIVGFAQPNIIELSFTDLSMLVRFKYILQSYFFARSDKVLVESNVVKDKFIKKFNFSSNNVLVAHNAISPIFLNTNMWRALEINRPPNKLVFGYLGRNYPHKNINFFTLVHKKLLNDYNINSVLYVTFTDAEWNGMSNDFKKIAVNIGPIALSECPGFYKAIDFLFFPSLAECFSISPIEAMYMGVPVFASDRDFVKESCSEYVNYIDPNDSASAALVIKNYIDQPVSVKSLELDNAKYHIKKFISSSLRSEIYKGILS